MDFLSLAVIVVAPIFILSSIIADAIRDGRRVAPPPYPTSRRSQAEAPRRLLPLTDQKSAEPALAQDNGYGPYPYGIWH